MIGIRVSDLVVLLCLALDPIEEDPGEEELDALADELEAEDGREDVEEDAAAAEEEPPRIELAAADPVVLSIVVLIELNPGDAPSLMAATFPTSPTVNWGFAKLSFRKQRFWALKLQATQP